MDFLLQLLLILIVAKFFGELFERVGIPAMIGEIGAGIVLGPAILGIVVMGDTLKIFSDIGIITLLFISGVEMDVRLIVKSKGIAASTALAGVVVPFVTGWIIGTFFGLTFFETLFIAIVLSVTSIGISVRTLIDMKKINTIVGTTIVSAAVLDDIIGIFLIAVLISFASQGTFSPGSFLPAIAVSLIFLVVFLTVGKVFILKLFSWTRKTETHEMVYSTALIIGIASAYLAHSAGLHYSIGAFIAGAILGGQIRSDRVLLDSLMDVAFGFFVTIFFVSIGLLFTPDWNTVFTPLLFPIIILAFAGKIAGGFIGSGPFMDWRSSLVVGIGLCPRGEITLVIANIALAAGIITAGLYSSVTVMVIVTILLTPFMMKKAFSSGNSSDSSVNVGS